MKLSDAVLLAKKILVGIAIGVVPLVILSGGLWITQRSFTKNLKKTISPTVEASRAN